MDPGLILSLVAARAEFLVSSNFSSFLRPAKNLATITKWVLKIPCMQKVWEPLL